MKFYLRHLLFVAGTLAFALLAPSRGISATLTGTIVNAQGTPYTSLIQFVPIGNPQIEGGIVITRRIITITATNGVFSQMLEQGNYRVIVDGQNSILIAVPNDGETYNFQNLAVNNLTYVYQQPPASSATLANLADTLNVGTATNAQVLAFNAGSRKWSPTNQIGGVGTPGGSNGQLQFNSAGTLAGLSAGTLQAHTNLSQLGWPVYNVKNFGAVGNGSTDDTSAFVAAYNEIRTNGGLIYVPFSTNAYLVNLVITNDNVTIFGDGADVGGSTNNVLRPFNPALPVIQIGNDSRNVYGTRIIGLGIIAEHGGTNGAGALHLLGGAVNSKISQVTLLGGSDTLKLQGGASFPSTLNKFSQCSFWEGTNFTIKAVYPVGGSFTTGNSFSDCYVNGHNTSGFTVGVDNGRPIAFSNTYFDMADNRGFYLTNNPAVAFQNCFVETATGPGLFTIDHRPGVSPDFDPTRYIEGDASDFQGTILFWDATSTNTFTIPGTYGWHGLHRFGIEFDPVFMTRINFTTPTSPQSRVYQLELAGTNQTAEVEYSRTDLADPRLAFRGTNTFLRFYGPTNTDRIFAFDFLQTGTNKAGVELFRNTSQTNELYFELHQGVGGFARQTRLAANGNSFVNALAGNVGIGTAAPTARLHVAGTGLFADTVTVPALAYDANTWNGNLTVPTRDDVRDKIEAIIAGTTIGVNGSAVSNPNFTNSPTAVLAVGAVTNITVNPTNLADAQISASAAIAKSKISSSGTWTAPEVGLGSADATKFLINGVWTNKVSGSANADIGLQIANSHTGQSASAQIGFDTDEADGVAGIFDGYFSADDPGMVLGTSNDYPVSIGVNNSERLRITSAGGTMQGTWTNAALTASRPVKTGAAKELTSGLIDMGSANDITGQLTSANIQNNAVDNTKIADMAQNRIKGRVTASTGDPEDLTPAQTLTVLESGGGVNIITATEIDSMSELEGIVGVNIIDSTEFTFAGIGAGTNNNQLAASKLKFTGPAQHQTTWLSGATPTIDLSVSDAFAQILTTNTTYSVINLPTGTNVGYYPFSLWLTNSSTTLARTVDFGANSQPITKRPFTSLGPTNAVRADFFWMGGAFWYFYVTDQTGPVPVADGGTGTNTLTSGEVLVGNGTSPVMTRAITGTGLIVAKDTPQLNGANPTNYLDFNEIAAPSTPATNRVRVYGKDVSGNTKLFIKDDSGNETQLGSGGANLPSQSFITKFSPLLSDGSSAYWGSPDTFAGVTEEFSGANVPPSGWNQSIDGTGASAKVASRTNAPGISGLSASATGDGYKLFYGAAGTDGFIPGNGEIVTLARVALPTLSTSGERYTSVIGLTSGNFGPDDSSEHGVAAFYNEATSANWKLTYQNGTTITTNTSSTAVSTTWQWVGLVIDPTGTNVVLYAGSTLAGISPILTNTATTMPTAAIRPLLNIRKVNSTAARTLELDFYAARQKFSNAR